MIGISGCNEIIVGIDGEEIETKDRVKTVMDGQCGDDSTFGHGIEVAPLAFCQVVNR